MASLVSSVALLSLALLLWGCPAVVVSQVARAESAIRPAEAAIQKGIDVAITFRSVYRITSCISTLIFSLHDVEDADAALKQANITQARKKVSDALSEILLCRKEYVPSPPPLLRSALDKAQSSVQVLVDALGH